MQGTGILIALYLLLIWVSLCYVTFPVSPFGFWDIVKWLVIAASLVCGTIGLALGLTTVALVLFLLVYISILFLLSFCYLAWTIWQAFNNHLHWINRYYKPIITGLLSVIGLATFVEGSNRYWSEVFDSTEWIKLSLIGLGAWSALFCQLMRPKTSVQNYPRRIIKWTLIVTVGLAVLQYWRVERGRDYFFLSKEVREHANDATAWLNFGWHNYFEGYKLQSDPGDEDHSPPDPTPSFTEALRCFNRAILLGERGFDTYSARAEMAHELGKKEESILFAQEALRIVGSDTTSDENAQQIQRLREIIVRDSAQPNPEQINEQVVKAERRQKLPEIVRWVYDYF